MAGRRFGMSNKLGPGGNGPNFTQPMSPWQGGSAPGALNPGILSQLSAPQAQLALALTSLLQSPHQQMNNNPPSLLSLSPSPNFPAQDNFGHSNRFVVRGREFRRSEPYIKNQNRSGGGGGGQWRTEVSSYRNNSNYGHKNQNRNNSRQNSRKANDNKGGNNKTRSDKSQTAVKTAANVDEQSSKVSETNSTANRAETVAEEKKRDWKEEKKTDEETTTNNEKKTTESTSTKRVRDGRYSDIPPSLLHCFVCNKSMWDGESFQNHLRGKAHKQMLDSLEESCQITVNIMRENMRLAEEKKMIELERMHRNNRNFHRKPQEPQSHCNMCDLKFLGKIISHRKTEGHQRLKRFLHPKCEPCTKEFASRLEWIDHRLTPEHLRQVNEVLQAKTGGENGSIIQEEFDVNIEPLFEEGLQMENENPVLELSDDMKDVHNRIPAYKPSRQISKESVHPVSGFYCDICYRFFVSDDVVQQHLKSEKHHNSFVEAVKYKCQRQEEEAAEAAEAENAEVPTKRSKTDEDVIEGEGEELYDPEEACEEPDGNTLTLSHDNEELLLEDDEKKWAEVDATIEEKSDVKIEIKEEARDLGDPSDMPSTPQQRILRRPSINIRGRGRGRK